MKVSEQTAQDDLPMATSTLATGVMADLSEKDAPATQIAQSHLSDDSMNQALLDRYLCPERFVDLRLMGELSKEAGFFRFGPSTTCYGRSVSGYRANQADAHLYDAFADVTVHGTTVAVPFNPND